MTIYVVRQGDTLSQIARRYGTDTDSLIYANQLQNPDTLSVGQALVIPVEQVTYTVRQGNTINAIARAYGVEPAALLSANPALGTGNRIYPGQTLQIPFPNEQSGPAVVNGYITGASESVLRATLPYLTFLSPFSFRADGYGELAADNFVDTALSADYRTANLLTVANLMESGGFSSAAAHAILTDQDVQDNFLENLLSLLDGGEWYGVNLDFEYVWPFDRGSYNQFLRRLAETLHGRGYILVTALAPKLSDTQSGLLYSAHDYAAQGEIADYCILMTYEWGYTYGPAMAVSPLDKVRQVLDYAVSVMPAGKILMGVPNYGYNWTLPFVQGSAARPVTNIGAVTLAGQVGTDIRFDQSAQSPCFCYTDGSGRQHEVWFEDARSLQAKFRLVREYGLAGVSFWNLNSLFRTIFYVLESMYSVEKALPAPQMS
ncbi:MAG: LysM peptidoglycan-binding domain-containing protein [Oscillospiraceae bacterium]|nr:LysM peptidoglycan-binding domain-containing protein [Oscillospiraceae bacterium]